MNWIFTLLHFYCFKRIPLLVLFTCIYAVGFTQAPTHTPRFSPVLDDNINGFWEYLPRDYTTDISQTYPLLVYLHGAGDQGSTPNETTLNLLKRNGPPKIIDNGIFPESFTVNGNTFRFIVISPQIKNGVSGVTSTITPATVDAVVQYARDTYRVDPTRIYVTGMSMGGGGTWYYASSDIGSRKLAAIAVAAGAADLTNEQAQTIASQKIPVLATHNTVDYTVVSSRTVANISKINPYVQPPAPAPVAVYWNTPGQKNPQETDDGEHNVWTRTFEDIEPGITAGGNLRDSIGMNVYEWLLQYVNTSDIPVPVTWESFTATEKNRKAVLQWVVSAQMNVKEFIVERSADNIHYATIGVLKAVDQTGTITYQFTDEYPFSPQTYYRIKELDIDERYSYSSIKKISLATYTGTPQVYPNPATSSIYLKMPAGNWPELLIDITDVNGRRLRLKKIQYRTTPVEIDGFRHLSAGLYLITVQSGNGNILLQEKVIKK